MTAPTTAKSRSQTRRATTTTARATTTMTIRARTTTTKATTTTTIRATTRTTDPASDTDPEGAGSQRPQLNPNGAKAPASAGAFCFAPVVLGDASTRFGGTGGSSVAHRLRGRRFDMAESPTSQHPEPLSAGEAEAGSRSPDD